VNAEDVFSLSVNTAGRGLQGGSRFGYAMAVMTVFMVVVMTTGAACGRSGVFVIMAAGAALVLVRMSRGMTVSICRMRVMIGIAMVRLRVFMAAGATIGVTTVFMAVVVIASA
jgi:hypothetical protein